MTEEEWLGCDDPDLLLDFLAGRTSGRKLRLFGVAACYLAPSDIGTLPRPRQVLEVVVGYADGLIPVTEVRKLWGRGHTGGLPDDGPPTWPERPLEWVRDFISTCRNGEIRDEFGYPPPDALPPYLRDIFGNPFRPVTFFPEWKTDTALSLARTMYDGRDFSAMPILADALQDAGCEEVEVLNHCRSGGVHVRGCWVVDLVLGKG